MVAKKLALQRSFADPSTPGCKVVAAAISMLAPFTHRSSLAGAQPGLPKIYDIYKCLLRDEIYIYVYSIFAEIW